MASKVNSEVRIRLSVYFFTSGGPPLSGCIFAVSRSSAADRCNAKKAHSAFAGHCAALFSDSVVYSLLVVFLYTRFRAQG